MYSFEYKFKLSSYLVIFSGQLEGSDAEYGDEIDKIIKGFTENGIIFEKILFVFPLFVKEKIIGYLKKGGDSKILSNLSRAKNSDEVIFLSFNERSIFKLEYCHSFSDREYSVVLSVDNKLRDDVIKYGLRSIAEKNKNNIILRSPPGTVFQKPSGDNFEEFIKASEMSGGFSVNQFIAFSLLSRRPSKEIKNVWIDTASIAVFIEPLVYYIEKFDGELNRIRYHSFQSYGDGDSGGFKMYSPDIKEDVWVIISASSTNNMGRKLYKDWRGVKHSQILTFLSYNDMCIEDDFCDDSGDETAVSSNPGDQILFNIREFSSSFLNNWESLSNVPVKIIGENFTAQIEDPKKVLIKKSHKTAEISDFIDPLNSSGCIFLNKTEDQRTRRVYFDFCIFYKESSKLKDRYDRWLKDICDWYVPSGNVQVIYNSDKDSDNLLCEDIVNRIGSCRVRAFDERKNLDEIDKSLPVIAISPVITQGHKFIKLNSDLRILEHSSQRIFIAPFALPYSKFNYRRFIDSLRLAPRQLTYQFFNFRKAFIGSDEKENSWDKELEVLDDCEDSLLVDRKRRLQKKSVGVLADPGLSCHEGELRLKFNKDFAFWSEGYNPKDVNPSAVYLTVSSILQWLREQKTTLPNSDSLFRHVYQHAVLDPMNFSRFNDPLLQACLWRAAIGGELDYRTTKELSQEFVDILTRLARSRVKNEYNATLDILIGVATGKIGVERSLLLKLVNDLTDLFDGVDKCRSFLEVICYIRRKYLGDS